MNNSLKSIEQQQITLSWRWSHYWNIYQQFHPFHIILHSTHTKTVYSSTIYYQTIPINSIFILTSFITIQWILDSNHQMTELLTISFTQINTIWLNYWKSRSTKNMKRIWKEWSDRIVDISYWNCTNCMIITSRSENG